jgi:hypothetical protein
MRDRSTAVELAAVVAMDVPQAGTAPVGCSPAPEEPGDWPVVALASHNCSAGPISVVAWKALAGRSDYVVIANNYYSSGSPFTSL